MILIKEQTEILISISAINNEAVESWVADLFAFCCKSKYS